MKFDTGLLGSHFILEKGISYKGDELVESCEVGLVTLDSFRPGGGYKTGSEKPFDGGFKPSFVLAPGDVVIATTDVTQDGAVLCAPALIPNYEDSFSELVWSLDVAKLLPTTGDVRPEYLYNFLRIPLNRKRAAYGDTGTTVRRIPFDAMYEQVIPIPSIEEQDRINSFIATLDRKIELNTAMATTLERIAQSLFRSWFVDFDPVKAKMAGEKPVGMDDETAALFPDSMEDSEFGVVPRGWHVGSMASFFGLQGGYSFKSSSWKDTGVPVIKIGSVKPGIVDLNQVSYVDESLAAQTSDVYQLPRGSLVIGLTGYVGEVGLVMRHHPLPLLNQRVAKFLPVEGQWKIPFVYCLTRRPDFKRKVIDAATGSAQQNVSNSQILNLEACVPPAGLIGLFNAQFESAFEQILNLEEENVVLCELRSALLPRLISGELRIPEEDLVL